MGLINSGYGYFRGVLTVICQERCDTGSFNDLAVRQAVIGAFGHKWARDLGKTLTLLFIFLIYRQIKYLEGAQDAQFGKGGKREINHLK